MNDISNTVTHNQLIELRDQPVQMRDGVKLATDIYLPATNAGPFPVLMERTPYNKSGISRSEKTAAHPEPQTRQQVARWFASHGYAVVMQDCRGRYGSEGTFTKYLNEAHDGYDTLTWLVRQRWCNGRIGTMGLSYGAHTQTALAALNPPGLTAMFIDSGGFSSAFHSGIRQGGAFELKQATWAYRHALLSPATERDPERRKALEQVDIFAWFNTFPWQPGHSPLSAAPEYEKYLFSQWRSGLLNDDWKVPALYARGFYDNFPDIPVAIVGSWYDPYVRTCIDNFQGLLPDRRDKVKLLMGPWTHGQRSVSYAGDADFGPHAILDGNIAEDYYALRLAWFDQHLKCCTHSPTDALHHPVTYFVMGGGSGKRNAAGRLEHGGHWQHAEQWPPQNTAPVRFYCHQNHTLSQQPPTHSDQSLHYRYDPANPVPTIGGAIASGDPVMSAGAYDQREDPRFFACNRPGRALAERDDVLVFETEPLTNSVQVTGSVSATLWVSSDRPDTDFTVKLIDVYPPSDDYPEGFSLNLTTGILRARYRQGWDKEVWMKPTEVYPITVTLFDVSNRFAAGHRIRIDISSSNYPHFDRNPNGAEPQGNATRMYIANNTIYMDKDRPSHIQLSIEQNAP